MKYIEEGLAHGETLKTGVVLAVCNPCISVFALLEVCSILSRMHFLLQAITLSLLCKRYLLLWESSLQDVSLFTLLIPAIILHSSRTSASSHNTCFKSHQSVVTCAMGWLFVLKNSINISAHQLLNSKDTPSCYPFAPTGIKCPILQPKRQILVKEAQPFAQEHTASKWSII